MQDLDETETAVQLEVALTLLPLVGRWVELDEGQTLRSSGARLEGEDRRLVVHTIARRWLELNPAVRRGYGNNETVAIAVFTQEYVDNVEFSDLDNDDKQVDFNESLALVWRNHADSIRSGGAGVVR